MALALIACRAAQGESEAPESGEQTRNGGSTVSSEAAGDAVERGRYLVTHVAACGECHSPRARGGGYEPAAWLSGVDCFVDVAPEDPNAGCLSTRNLTNHETGLKNRTDAEIQDMFLRGVRPDGKALHPFMPYAFFGNMRASDAEAIVAYLRTVPGVEHTSAPSQPPFLAPKEPRARVPRALIPMPRPDYTEQAAALRGRYLAGEIGVCMDCHTPRGPEGVVLERAFEGGMQLKRSLLRLPETYPEIIYTANLTPHATGIEGYSVADLVRVLKQGEDKNQAGNPLCPPMPAGALAFGGLTDSDASDIGHYLLSLPPRENVIPVDCRVPDGASSSVAKPAGRGT